MTDDERFRRALILIAEAKKIAIAAAAELVSLIGDYGGENPPYVVACMLVDRVDRDWHRISEQRPVVTKP